MARSLREGAGRQGLLQLPVWFWWLCVKSASAAPSWGDACSFQVGAGG